MTLRAFLVDDEPPARVRLRQLLAETGDVLVVGEASDAIEARAAIADLRPDVVFLDIEMPQESGTALAASLVEPKPFVVFATAFDHYALDAFAVDATDYLVKPITRARLNGTLTRVRERLSRRSDLERELLAASATQAMLLPKSLPVVRGYDSAALTVPARGVGGDFFLGRQIGSRRVVLALGDVSGKGLSAGLVASSLQARLEAVASHAGGSASETVTDINKTLWATSDTARFATLVYVDLDADRHEVTFVNAGHLPAILTARGTTTQWLGSTSPALGILPDATFVSKTTPMPDNGMLVLYSDGVTEAIDGLGVEFGDERLLQVVERHALDTAAGLCQAIVSAVRHHALGQPAADDVTVMVIRRHDSPRDEVPAS
jgi:serine phosphatase RsbU (regulator of sigma subunit)